MSAAIRSGSPNLSALGVVEALIPERLAVEAS